MAALENCKLHGGPITLVDIQNLDNLTEIQVKSEVAYLKLTSGPNIRYKRKVRNKFVNFTVDELRSQIRDVIKPASNLCPDFNAAIKGALLSGLPGLNKLFEMWKSRNKVLTQKIFLLSFLLLNLEHFQLF